MFNFRQSLYCRLNWLNINHPALKVTYVQLKADKHSIGAILSRLLELTDHMQANYSGSCLCLPMSPDHQECQEGLLSPQELQNGQCTKIANIQKNSFLALIVFSLLTLCFPLLIGFPSLEPVLSICQLSWSARRGSSFHESFNKVSLLLLLISK